MQALVIFIVFLFGAVLASFLSVVADRWGSASWAHGRSHCDHCARHLNWYELIPIVSYLAMRGRCSRCKAPLSIAYPIGELLGGVGAVLLVSAFIYTPVILFFLAIFFCLMYVISRYDARHMLVLHELLFPAAFFAIIIHIAIIHSSMPLAQALATFAIQLFLNAIFIIAPFWLVWKLSKGTKIGLGDIYVFVPLALLLDFQGFIAMLFITSLTALIVSVLVAIAKRKKLTRATRLPLVPYLTFATLLVVALQFDILGLVSRFL